jgi:hypothetical protein
LPRTGKCKRRAKPRSTFVIENMRLLFSYLDAPRQVIGYLVDGSEAAVFHGSSKCRGAG